RRLGVPLAAEAEHDGWKAQRLGEIRERRHADAASDEERALDVEAVAVAERPEHVDRVAGLELAERRRSGPDRVDEERELARRLGGPLAAEAGHDGWKAQRLGEIRERRHADAASDEERALDVEAVAVAERPEHVDRVAGLELAERRRSGPDRVDEERELARRR